MVATKERAPTRHRTTRVKRPQSNGIVERLHRTLLDEQFFASNAAGKTGPNGAALSADYPLCTPLQPRQTRRNPLTLTTHAIVGAAIVHFMPTHPLLAVCLAFASHFLLDAFPHWDYPIWSTSLKPSIAAPMKYDRALFTDMLTIGADAALGIVLAFIFFTRQESFLLMFCGAFAAILPDMLQFAYMRFPREPLASIQQFHRWIHTSHGMQPVFGIISQFAFVIVFMVVVCALLPR